MPNLFFCRIFVIIDIVHIFIQVIISHLSNSLLFNPRNSRSFVTWAKQETIFVSFDCAELNSTLVIIIVCTE